MSNIVKLKRSAVFNKTPLPSQLDYGELCLNFNSSNPFLSFKDSENEIQKFLSENKVRNLIADVKNDVDASFYTKAQINQMFEDLESGGTITFDDYYTKIESDAKYQTLSGMSSYLTVASAEGLYQPKGDYALVSQLPDLTEYALKSELDDYLTIASASTIYATKEELEEHIPTVDAYTKAETDTLLAGKANSAHTHDYETLTNKPDLSNFATKGEIPDTSSFATKQELEDYQMKSGMSAYLLASEAQDTYQAKGTYVVPSDLNNYVTSGYAEETFAKKGDVPTDVYTKSETDTLLAGKANSAHTHTASEIVDLDVPKIWKGTLAEYTNLTEIDSDTLYVITDESEQFTTSGEVESLISGFTTLSEVEVLLGGFSPTGHTHVMSDITDLDIPSLEGYATETWVGENFQPQSGMSAYSQTGHTHSYNDLEDKPTIPSIEGLASMTDLANYQPVSGMSEYSTTAHTHSYTALTDLPDLSIYLTEHQDISGLATKQELENYMPNSGMTDYALKSEIPSIEGLATEAELANYQPVSSMTGYSTTAHTHSYNDLEDKPTIPSTSGLASETWVTDNFAGTGHTHSQYLTQTSADSRYARVVSCTQAEYDALVQNDQVEQGVLYCIYEGSQSSSEDSGNSGNSGNSGDPGGNIPDTPIIPGPDPIDDGNDF